NLNDGAKPGPALARGASARTDEVTRFRDAPLPSESSSSGACAPAAPARDAGARIARVSNVPRATDSHKERNERSPGHHDGECTARREPVKAFRFAPTPSGLKALTGSRSRRGL